MDTQEYIGVKFLSHAFDEAAEAKAFKVIIAIYLDLLHDLPLAAVNQVLGESDFDISHGIHDGTVICLIIIKFVNTRFAGLADCSWLDFCSIN